MSAGPVATPAGAGEAPLLVVRHARAATMEGRQGDAGLGPLALLEDAALVARGERLIYVGPDAGLPALPGGPRVELDAGGLLVGPGYVEPHSHLLFAGDRSGEFERRIAGETYGQIAAAGGGIRATVRATRAASDEELLRSARARLGRLCAEGVTTCEVKTGYGLSLADELRLLRLATALGGEACEVVPTLLGLHAVPEGIDRAAWVRTVAGELVPAAARAGARGCDAFCEQGAFTAEECRAALAAGRAEGLTLHLHADQLTAGGGAELAGELFCASADHLERTSPAGVQALARGGVAAVLLPLAAFFLRDPRPAQAAPFLAAGVPVALGGNLNPGSQRIEGHSFLLAAGCLLSGLSPAQALWACTRGAALALALPDRGALRPGLRADLVLHAVRDPAHLCAHPGVSHARAVVRGGRVVLRRSEAELPVC